ncbi:hypothetical protein BBD39_10410 [Arsenophonus endosymbiont of Bemisia tabaci Asia II 3]|nr:hypothetical protein BBD39_10410 [Arsenophonus endosymbiont of Bemisia tabaci Asia II 3]
MGEVRKEKNEKPATQKSSAFSLFLLGGEHCQPHLLWYSAVHIKNEFIPPPVLFIGSVFFKKESNCLYTGG